MIKGKQKIIRTACPLFVGVWMLGITFFRDFFRMQEFVYENGRKASVIQYIGLYFSSGNGYIKQPAFFSVWILVAFCQDIIKHWVIAYK